MLNPKYQMKIRYNAASARSNNRALISGNLMNVGGDAGAGQFVFAPPESVVLLEGNRKAYGQEG